MKSPTSTVTALPKPQPETAHLSVIVAGAAAAGPAVAEEEEEDGDEAGRVVDVAVAAIVDAAAAAGTSLSHGFARISNGLTTWGRDSFAAFSTLIHSEREICLSWTAPQILYANSRFLLGASCLVGTTKCKSDFYGE